MTAQQTNRASRLAIAHVATRRPFASRRQAKPHIKICTLGVQAVTFGIIVDEAKLKYPRPCLYPSVVNHFGLKLVYQSLACGARDAAQLARQKLFQNLQVLFQPIPHDGFVA